MHPSAVSYFWPPFELSNVLATAACTPGKHLVEFPLAEATMLTAAEDATASATRPVICCSLEREGRMLSRERSSSLTMSAASEKLQSTTCAQS